MLEYTEEINGQNDFCEVCARQMAYISALALNNACVQIGK